MKMMMNGLGAILLVVAAMFAVLFWLALGGGNGAEEAEAAPRELKAPFIYQTRDASYRMNFLYTGCELGIISDVIAPEERFAEGTVQRLQMGAITAMRVTLPPAPDPLLPPRVLFRLDPAEPALCDLLDGGPCPGGVSEAVEITLPSLPEQSITDFLAPMREKIRACGGQA